MFPKCKDLSPILALLLIFTLLLVPTAGFAGGDDDGCSRNWNSTIGTEEAGGGDPDNPVPMDGDDGDRAQYGAVSTWVGDEVVSGSDPDFLKVVRDLIGALSLL